MASVGKRESLHGSARAAVRALLLAGLALVVVFALSCSSSSAPSSESVGTASSAVVTGCGQVQVTASPGAPGNTALSSSYGVILPSAIPISNFGGFYPNIQVTATLGVGTTSCTYSATFPSSWGDAQFQSCADGSVPGDIRWGSSTTLSISTTPSYPGTTGTATLGLSPDDKNPCSIDLCQNGSVTHSNAADGTA